MPRLVQVNVQTAEDPGQVVLPDGKSYADGEQATLTNEQFGQIDPDLIGGDTTFLIQDLGIVGTVLNQGPLVTLTSGPVSDPPTKAEVDAIQADLVALHAALTGPDTALSDV